MFCKKYFLKISQNTQSTVSFANPTDTAIDIAIIRSSYPVVFCEKDVLTNFAKFTKKHLRQSLVFNETANLQSLSLSLSKKQIAAQIFSCELCEIFQNTFFKEPFGRLLPHKTRSVYCPTTTFCLFRNDVTHIFRLSIFST